MPPNIQHELSWIKRFSVLQSKIEAVVWRKSAELQILKKITVRSLLLFDFLTDAVKKSNLPFLWNLTFVALILCIY